MGRTAALSFEIIPVDEAEALIPPGGQQGYIDVVRAVTAEHSARINLNGTKIYSARPRLHKAAERLGKRINVYKVDDSTLLVMLRNGDAP